MHLGCGPEDFFGRSSGLPLTATMGAARAARTENRQMLALYVIRRRIQQTDRLITLLFDHYQLRLRIGTNRRGGAQTLPCPQDPEQWLPYPPLPYWVRTLFGRNVTAPRLGHIISVPTRICCSTDNILHSNAWAWVPSSGCISLNILNHNGLSSMILCCFVDREVD